MWLTMKAMIRSQAYLDRLNHLFPDAGGFFMIMQVHDELVFDFSKGSTPKGNYGKVMKIAALMEKGGEDIGVPTPVSVECHPNNWSEGVTV